MSTQRKAPSQTPLWVEVESLDDEVVIEDEECVAEFEAELDSEEDVPVLASVLGVLSSVDSSGVDESVEVFGSVPVIPGSPFPEPHAGRSDAALKRAKAKLKRCEVEVMTGRVYRKKALRRAL